ncbi:MAG TPA: hypothetical protein PKW80_08220 [Bacteroidales bacterium]|nr:hypothetical protein [Bacteroidales bacterium]
MKKNISFTTGILFTIIISAFFFSCRKIDSAKLCGDWKIVSLNSTFEYLNKKHETTFDGAAKIYTYTVKDTAYSVDSVFTYVETKTYTGMITTDFHPDGTYNYSETFKNDVTGITETQETEGLWFFTDANRKTGYRIGDLLALQAGKLTFNTNAGDVYTTIYQGDNTLDIYEISTLTKAKIVLKLEKAETINFVQYVTRTEFTLEPR